jgi:hypothetical protein
MYGRLRVGKGFGSRLLDYLIDTEKRGGGQKVCRSRDVRLQGALRQSSSVAVEIAPQRSGRADSHPNSITLGSFEATS